MTARFRVEPGKSIALSDYDPSETHGRKEGPEADSKMKKDLARLFALQSLLYASRRNSVLIVLQGIDTAGKDGTIRHVFSGVNPQGCRVACFKEPSGEELDHDYLWRIHRETPARGEMVVFNRSHYESVLVERVHGLVPKSVWRKRYDEINEFEKVLVRSGTVILKFFLNLSRGEQKRRLEARLADPAKRWKANPADWKERKLWSRYQEAFDDMLSRTSTRRSPWHIIPSDHKWYRNLAVAHVLTRSLEPYEEPWRRAVLSRGAAALKECRRDG